MFIRRRRPLPACWLAGLALLLGAGLFDAASAQETPPKPPTTPSPTQESPPPREEILAPVVVTAPPPVSASSEVFIPGKDFELRPQGRPADVLRLVPGLVISQHQGGGKAEQYFLRGFDADHGTDVALFIDGLPVNFRSHAHGQGYADLHFLIPETVQRLDGFKGPYFVEYGDFATAGAFNFVLRDTVDENYAEAAGGSFGTQRYLTLLSPTRDALKTLVAIEYYRSDGPFTHPNGYERFNLLAKGKASLSESMDLSVWASFYQADWHGSGEIPARAVRSGLIGRFDAIDPNEGGTTQRTNVNLDWRWRPTENQTLSAHAYATYYTLTLFNDFTFFLNDQQNGDMINQRDTRFMAGFDALYEHRSKPFDINLTSSAGFQYRIDTPRVVLATAVQRHQLARTQDVSIQEQSYSPFVKFDIVPLSWLRLVTGARGDIFTYDVHSRVNTTEDDLNGKTTQARPNVKANLVLGPWAQTEFYANFGTGYHSNDARAVVANPNLTALPTARGYEFGVRSKVIPRTEFSLTYWVIDLASELVFVGDEGTTEASGPSHRAGIEFATRVKLLDWLTFSGDVTWSRAEFDTGAAVALAPRLTARADLTARLPWGLSSSLGMRYLGDRYADEDRHQTARGYMIFDWTARYRYKWLEAFVSIENLTNTEYREAQFFFTSRLPGEPATGVPDIHYTPGNPISVMGGLALRF
ncbi:MAG TPA: TonB-dependent receptor plug domain-containing protein [Methylomirabilota bacterium]|nr:TonB-dependent receptor plug domain-containing protein [Methylomirabilota bacterium]